jgi:hypothetical protein
MNEVRMHIDIADLAGHEILAGRMAGRRLLSELLSATPEPAAPEACFLDFKNVQVATASFLRESILDYRRIVRGKRSTIYPVIANASDDILDDLSLVLRIRSDAMLACDFGGKGKPSNVRIVGLLEAVQRETFDLVMSLGEVDTSTLKKQHKAPGGVGITAWNNRLAALVSKGLVMERSNGRAKAYRAVVAG